MITNNFHLVRLVAAILVLYGHSFVFIGKPEPLFLSWSHWGPIAVYVFFIVSGYLISQSWDRDPHIVRFILRRALRIFPGLLVCLILSVFVLGSWLTTLTLSEYFSHPATLSYIPNNMMLYIQYYLPGIFETNRVASAVNGSLWSLPAEFFMYLLIALVSLRFGSRWVFLIIFLVFATLSYSWAQQTPDMLVIYGTDLRQIVMCGVYFWAGVVFHKFKLDRFISLPSVVIAGFILIFLESKPVWLNMASWILLPWVVLAFCLSYSPILTAIIGNRDYSYGIYIYAFPIQQAIIYLHPDISFYSYFLCSLVVTLIFAALSWHFVESKMLKIKPKSNQEIGKN